MQAAEQVVLKHEMLRHDPARLLGTADSSYSSLKVGGPDSSASKVHCCAKQQTGKTEISGNGSPLLM